MNRSAREGKSVKRFERSNGPDIALYKNYLYNTSTTPSLQTQLILSTVKYSFMLCITSVVTCEQKLTNIHQNEACLWEG